MNQDKHEFKLVVGSNPFEVLIERPKNIFSNEILNFFSELSKEGLRSYKKREELKEFVGFFFWARQANMQSLRNNYFQKDFRFGRGGSFHIAPSNVPANALFSLAFGLLSGSPAVIRISKNTLKNLEIVFEIINSLLENDKFSQIKKMISIINYDHNEKLNEKFSLISTSRIIWGGDRTIQLFKRYPTKADCIDLTFPDKTSSSIINVEFLQKISNESYQKLIENFSRDIATFSQNACSSPFFIYIYNFINKKETSKFLNKFFSDINLFLSKKFNDEIPTNENFKSSVDLLFFGKNSIERFFKGNKLFVTKVDKNLIKNLSGYKPQYACLCIVELSSLEEIGKLLPEKNQTIVILPFEKSMIDIIVPIIGPKGTNRVVQAGDALNMNLYWDGHDIVSSLSRIVQTF